MKVPAHLAVEALADEAPCLGAAFASYSFDPAFFEEQLLHAVLRLRSDPIEQTPRFLEEARAALQQAPVSVLVDGTVRQAGRRLPYELREIRNGTFHPKVALVLYPEFARLRVGSGNLTRAGHGGNTELFFQRDLDYRTPEDAGLLASVSEFFRRSAGRATPLPEGVVSSLDQVLDELGRRLRGVEVAEPTDVAWLTSLDGPIQPRFQELVTRGWVVERVSLLAPFHENDDAQAGADGELFSVARLLGESAKEVEVGVCWENAPVTAEHSTAASADDLVGQLCGWKRVDDEGTPSVQYLHLTAATQRQFAGTDQRGASRRWPRDEVEAAFDDGELFPVPPVAAHGPQGAVAELGAAGKSVTLALHPATRFEEGRPYRRILHGKLLLIAARRGQQHRTWALVGSANASRNALLRDAGDGGNVEACVAFQLDADVRLADVAPELVVVPPDLATLAPKTFPTPPDNFGTWIETAVYRARTRQLAITWAADGPSGLDAWTLAYDGRVLERGGPPPAGQSSVHDDVTLAVDQAEVVLHVGDAAYSVPIVIDDVAALPANPLLADPTLEELLALLGGRLGVERLTTLKSAGSPVGADAVLEAIFGDGIGTTDVFKAWWAIAQDLQADDISFAAFRCILEGPMGARAVWTKLHEAASTGAMSQEEVWFYGCELNRTLSAVELPALADETDRRALLDAFRGELTTALERLTPIIRERRWLEPIIAFYGERP